MLRNLLRCGFTSFSFASAVALLGLALPVLTGCDSARHLDRSLTAPAKYQQLDRRSRFLKAHLRDGTMVLFRTWRLDSARTVRGSAAVYDVNRAQTGPETSYLLPLDSVALFETNVVGGSGAVTGLTLMSAVSTVLSVVCISSPKTCFGSCPTFYLEGENDRPAAEGFSSSVLPSLEATDLDALFGARPRDGVLTLRMKNEALETHVVRSACLVAVPRADSERVVAAPDGSFWRASAFLPPLACAGPDGDCTAALTGLDGVERGSAADSSDIAAREIIDVTFANAAGGKTGLVIASRQSLLSTFLFYETLAAMGREAGSMLASLERGDPLMRAGFDRMQRAFGGIEVQQQDVDGSWQTIGEIREMGPLAADIHCVPLPPAHSSGTVRLRLRMTKGAWRIDWLSLATLKGKGTPVRIPPSDVLREGAADTSALRSLRGGSTPLVTGPGDEYTIRYRLPDADGQEYEFFLESRGYYLEWMREQWLADENLELAALIFLSPESAFRVLAPKYKRVEAEMESQFWSSRYGRR